MRGPFAIYSRLHPVYSEYFTFGELLGRAVCIKVECVRRVLKEFHLAVGGFALGESLYTKLRIKVNEIDHCILYIISYIIK